MKKSLVFTALVSAFLAQAGFSHAQSLEGLLPGLSTDYLVSDDYDDDAPPVPPGESLTSQADYVGGNCDCCCDFWSGWFADIDFIFMEMTQSDGLQDANGPGAANAANFDSEFTPRFTMGRLDQCGFGWQVRFWHHENDTISAGGLPVAVDTHVLDVELLQRYQITSCLSAQLAAGVRSTEFNYNRGANDQYSFDGFGLQSGLEVDYQLCSGNLYFNARSAVTKGDARIESEMVNDVPRMQTELGAGYEMIRCLGNGALLSIRFGYETQYWNNFVGSNDDDDDLTDIGFDGFLIGLGLEL